MAARLKDVQKELANGGTLTFVWRNCDVRLNGLPVDGRSYQAFLIQESKYRRTETGTPEAGDLVIEWRV